MKAKVNDKEEPAEINEQIIDDAFEAIEKNDDDNVEKANIKLLLTNNFDKL